MNTCPNPYPNFIRETHTRFAPLRLEEMNEESEKLTWRKEKAWTSQHHWFKSEPWPRSWGVNSCHMILAIYSGSIVSTQWIPSFLSSLPLSLYMKSSKSLWAMSNPAASSPVIEEKVKYDIVTLTRFLTEEQTKHKEATGDFTHALPPAARPTHTDRACLQQAPLPCPPIFFQINSLLHPPCNSHQLNRTCRLFKHNRWRPKETWRNRERSLHRRYAHFRKMSSSSLRRGRKLYRLRREL